ncbi:MAG: ATP-binding protein, partial [Candidatus Binatia bacterium]
MPLLPVIDVVKSSFGIEEADGEATIIERVERGVERIDRGLRPIVPYLRYLLAVDPGDRAVDQGEANARRFKVFEALKQLTLASAARRPLVIVIEDLHWIDAPSEEYLNYLSDALPTARVLLLCTYRPGYRNPFAERSYATRIALQPLSAEESTSMAARMLETSSLPAEVRAVITRKAEGNPFFVEEVTKSLVEIEALRRTPQGLVLGRNASEIVIPGTIQEVIMARIDRLGEEPKRAIQVASVIGREFAARLLQRVADLGERLHVLVGELRSLELIYEKTGVPELAYMFKHALTHDVAYESLLVQRRKELHRVIGLAIEELYADRLGEYCEMLAHHYFEGDDRPKAFEYLLRAGDKAAATFANAEVLYFLDRALEAARHFDARPADLARVHEGRANALFARSEFGGAIAACDRALALAATERDVARIEALKAGSLVWAHEFDAARASAERVIGLGERLDDPETIGGGYYTRGLVSGVRGDLAASEHDMEHASAFAERCGSVSLRARTGTFYALIRNWRGEYVSAIDMYGPIIAALKHENQLFELTMLYSHFTITLGGAGRYGEALATIADAIHLGEMIGDRVWRARLWNTRGWILAELGDFEAAEEANHRCLEIARATGSSNIVSELIGNAEANLADAALAQGDPAGAEPHLAAVAAILADRRNEWMAWRFGMHHESAASDLALGRGDLGRARRHVESCLAAAERTRSRRYLVRGQRQLAAIELGEGRSADAERRLVSVVRDARTLGNPPQLWSSLLLRARALQELGRSDQAMA